MVNCSCLTELNKRSAHGAGLTYVLYRHFQRHKYCHALYNMSFERNVCLALSASYSKKVVCARAEGLPFKVKKLGFLFMQVKVVQIN